MLQPKRTKWRKVQTGKNRGIARRGSDVSFGEYALQATDRVFLTARQIEACRMAIQRHTKRQGKLYIRIFPDKPLTKKPLEVRMGKGKGGVDCWVAVIKPGRVLFEIADVPEDLARSAFRVASNKLPVATRFLKRGAL
ncbi:MAG: 50S ribosomal protein L16 [Polyangiaceae bacterium]|nr:50S ribosomal protein L16 [Polyangiaceae bacterium]